MIRTCFSQSIYLFLSIFLCGALPLSARKDAVINLSEFKSVRMTDEGTAYIYLGRDLSNLIEIVSEISELDDEFDSPLHALKKHIDEGFFFAEYEAVIEALEYAEFVIARNYKKIDARATTLAHDLAVVIQQIDSEELIIIPRALNILGEPEENVDPTIYRRRGLVIDENIDVLGKSLFMRHVHTREGIHCGGRLKVDKNATFKKNVKIKGTLSAADAVIGTLSVTDLVVASCIDSLCVDNLSVNDLVVASCVDNFCVINLSVANEVVQNLSATNATLDNLSVTNCMTSLCVDDFSAIDASISGTLSVNDAFINIATIQSLNIIATVLDSIIDNLTVTGTASINDAVISNLTVLNCMTNLCVNDLSVVDLAVSGFVSLVDAAVENLSVLDGTVITLSANDAIVDNLTVTNCVSSLCVNDLSVIDISVSGILSAADAIINENLQIIPLTPAGVVHNDASGNLSTSLIVNADVDPAAGIVDSKLATISTAGKVANSATTATSANTANAIVARDGSGNFSAGTITANLSGNATTATSATNFTGSLAGDVTGTQSATVVSFVGGQTAANVAAATVLANAATNANTASTIVKRDASGNFSATTITANLSGNATTATNFTGSLAGDVTGTQSATVVSLVGGQTAANVAAATVLANAATSADTASTIVKRDASGNFATNMITLDGTTTNPTDAATKSYVDAQIGGGGTSLNTPNTTVRRDGTGSFAAQIVSVVDSVVSRNLILSTDPSTSTSGNILKGSNRFIHDAGAASNIFAGENAGSLSMTGAGNSGFGANALSAVTSGLLNTAVGNNALSTLTANSFCVAIGGNTLVSNTTDDLVAVGYNALNANTTGGQNTAVGHVALQANTIGSANTAMGFASLQANTTGSANTAVGQNSLNVNTTGTNNVAIGAHVLQSNTAGNLNTGVGFNALEALTTGSDNVALGNNTLEALTTGSSNLALGAFAGQDSTTSDSNNIYLSNIGVAGESNTTRIGGSQTRFFAVGIRGVTTGVNNAIAVLIDSNGQLGTTSSSVTRKRAIQDMDDSSADILKLRPVTFIYKEDQSNTIQYGLIAEEVAEIFPNIVVRNGEGKPESVQYHVLPALLLNEMKKQHATIEQMNSVIASLQQQVQEFMERVKKLENQA